MERNLIKIYLKWFETERVVYFTEIFKVINDHSDMNMRIVLCVISSGYIP